jgi:hypothetical protein
MVPASFSNTITKGADWSFGFQIRENGPCTAVSDLTDWTFSATFATSSGASLTTPSFLLHTPECPVFSLTHTQTAAMARQTGASLIINAIRPDGYHIELLRGRITIF